MAAIDHASARRAPAVAISAPIVTWPNALAAFVLLVWLLPIKSYRLPVGLPFNLELYRVALIVLAGAFVVAMAAGRGRLSAGGVGVPLTVLVVAILASQVANVDVLDPAGGDKTALKGFFYLLSFALVFVVVCSAIRDREGADRVVQAIVLGAVVVAAAAFIESRTRYNVFDHLGDWLPVLDYDARYDVSTRGGVPRVRASAQHPIALASALTLAVPLALYLYSRATATSARVLWAGAALLIALAALVPVARTAVVMAAVMVVLGVVLRGRRVLRYWPVLIIALALLHLARPGVMGALYKSFFPEQGLLDSATGRAGLQGSGRLSDLTPGLELWRTSPLFGIGRGNALVGGRAADDPEGGIIFDNQYLNGLVTLGAAGLAALTWFLGASLWKLIRGGRARAGPAADLVVACALATAAFVAAMYFFDAFSFVQVTLFFFIVAAIGLRALTFVDEEAPRRRPAGG